jgi:beta-N-acetylhexosaminidase
VGVNVDLAPVLDVARRGSIMERQRRSFSRSAARVARIGGAFARGLDAGNVAATGKHFPGLGSARRNQDLQVNRIRSKLKTLRSVDERPYKGGDLQLVMLSSAIYPALSRSPAVFSKRVVNGELRGHAGFKGVTISDALDASAMSRYGSRGRRAVRAARAGVDLLLYTDDGTSLKALVASSRSGSLSRAALRASARRTLRLRASLR